MAVSTYNGEFFYRYHPIVIQLSIIVGIFLDIHFHNSDIVFS